MDSFPKRVSPGAKRPRGKWNGHTRISGPASSLEQRSFSDLTDLNEKGRNWLDNVANVRVHGTTQAIPFDRLKRELENLNPLRDQDYVLERSYCEGIPAKKHKRLLSQLRREPLLCPLPV